jgi:hypothetical protein
LGKFIGLPSSDIARALQMVSERRFTALIAAIYDAGTDFRCWPKAMRLMAQAFNAPAVVMGCNSPASGRSLRDRAADRSGSE